MWKKWLGFSAALALIIMLDPTHTPAQPGGGKGKKGDRGGFGQPPGGGFGRPPRGDGGSGFPAPSGDRPSGFGQPPSGGGFGHPPGGGFSRSPGGDRGPGGGFGQPPGGGPGGGGFGGGDRGPGGGGSTRGRGIDPEQGWTMLQRLTNSTGDTVDLSKIPPQTQTMLKGMAARTGALPLPENGIMTKAQYLEHHARSEQARASFSANGGSMSMDSRDRGRSGFDPNGGYGQGGWGGGDFSQGWGGRGDNEKKEVEEERPVVMRYGKFPEAVKAALPSWYDELDTDKDAQVSLYEWRNIGKRDLKEFLKMDLNGDGLVTADEFIRFTRQETIATNVAAFEAGERDPGNWKLGEPLEPKPGEKTGRPGRGPGGFGPGGGGGFGPGGFGGATKGGSTKGGNTKSDRSERKNPWNK